ncbi:TetR family transcriptional regulator [Isoptericola jiangsuensis]|uniref:TetR family transcriptional regulator n=1 Tax=Isoptericola jiangsuensis TaxID=548579 RepID=A0A2A9ETR2_9MICO|nr:TetR family transcriptional regulator [Isoptericola jiangsuensis]PFG41625.1 TetR family transcriptional regulator [Isoptericola jiangsuensis]
MSDSAPRRRPGRPAGTTGAREQILDAARSEFAAHGYRGATLRRIAARAGVDPALVHHYFGDKDGLFAETVEPPAGVADRMAEALAGPPDQLGERVARTFLGVWESPKTRDQMLTVVRSALTHDVARDRLRGLVLGRVLDGALAGTVPEHERRLRVELAMTQVIGIALARYVVELEPLATLPVDDVVALLAPAVQRHLLGPLPALPSQG